MILYFGPKLFNGIQIRTIWWKIDTMSFDLIQMLLFNITIREKIALVEHFTDEQMEKALCDSALAGDLANMPRVWIRRWAKKTTSFRAARNSVWSSPVLRSITTASYWWMRALEPWIRRTPTSWRRGLLSNSDLTLIS